MSDPALPNPPSSPPPAKKVHPAVFGCGGCGCLVVAFVIGLVIGGVWLYLNQEKRLHEPSKANTETTSVPPGWTTFVNVRSPAMPPQQQKDFLDFSVSYPPDKFKTPLDWPNFINITAKTHDATLGDLTLDTLYVGYLGAPAGPSDSDHDTLYPLIFSKLSQELSPAFPNFKELNQIPDTLGGVHGRAMLFKAEDKNGPHGSLYYYGKIILARQPGQNHGAVMVMYASSLDPDVHSPEDVGVEGVLGDVVRSFKFTK